MPGVGFESNQTIINYNRPTSHSTPVSARLPYFTRSLDHMACQLKVNKPSPFDILKDRAEGSRVAIWSACIFQDHGVSIRLKMEQVALGWVLLRWQCDWNLMVGIFWKGTSTKTQILFEPDADVFGSFIETPVLNEVFSLTIQ